MPKNEVKIQIRCSEELRVEFKKVAAEFGSYQDAIKAFIEAYKRNPNLFKYRKVGTRWI